MHWPAERLRDATPVSFILLNFLSLLIFLLLSETHMNTQKSQYTGILFDYKQKLSASLIQNIYTKSNK